MRNKILIVLGGVLVIIGVAYLSTHHSHSPNINLTLSPTPANAKLDGKDSVKNGKLYVTPGAHSITASFRGFASQTVAFTAKANQLTDVTVLLLPNSNEGYQWLSDHPEEAAKRRQVSGTAFNTSSTKRENTTPLIQHLPYYERYFKVDYGPSVKNPNDDTAVAIYVTFYAPQGKQQALDWIKGQGVDPNTLEIVFTDQSVQTTGGGE